ncbi:hypothetical protein NOI24_16315 [Neorhizobium galegae]|uniref:hypothetical protein n=1 Tax=Neorhizobium galegae TaxID=399 RepID=UPI002107AFE8|nr:hypothetical protein [Neorhizobium galegae]MCQ1772875.1 hypothetical protein [Neorhizobium galegae]MCQ1799178.1 hypothetical protein [Neorhizobium galegae]
MKYNESSKIKNIRLANTKHTIDLIKSKIQYEMERPNYSGPSTVSEYIETHLFSLTVSTRSLSKPVTIHKAQETLKARFSTLYAEQIRLWGIENTKLNKRNAHLQPLVITFFDVEGSRHSQAATTATMPHYHGVILIHHDAIHEFLRHLTRNQLDGTYGMSKPSSHFSSIYLQPLPTFADAERFLGYSAKYTKHNADTNNNYNLTGYYPEKSKYFPFYEYVKNQKN